MNSPPLGPPTFRLEHDLARRLGGGDSNRRVAGVDEAGRGPLAGPVVAAAVVWGDNPRIPEGLNDSKQLTARDRDRIFRDILENAEAVGVALATAREIDATNILRATRLAACRALGVLPVPPVGVLTDALTLPDSGLPVEPIVKGDCLSIAIAAASVVAKVVRDRLMAHYADQYPGYGWTENRGYGTPEHCKALERDGPTTLHRLTFAGVGFFSEWLRPSREFVRLFRAWADDQGAGDRSEKGADAPRSLPVGMGAGMSPFAVPAARAWEIRRRATGPCHPPDPAMASLLAVPAPGGSLAPEHCATFLDEGEIEALARLRGDPTHRPAWLGSAPFDFLGLGRE